MTHKRTYCLFGYDSTMNPLYMEDRSEDVNKIFFRKDQICGNVYDRIYMKQVEYSKEVTPDGHPLKIDIEITRHDE